MRLGFKQCYEKFILDGSKRSTCRLGDKSNRFQVGDIIDIVIGSRFKPKRILKAQIMQMYVGKWKGIEDDLLEYESPDCQTKDGLYCTMYHINKKLIENNDIITLISWRLI